MYGLNLVIIMINKIMIGTCKHAQQRSVEKTGRYAKEEVSSLLVGVWKGWGKGGGALPTAASYSKFLWHLSK